MNWKIKLNSLRARYPWLTRLGFAAFLFFLIKGLIWVALFFVAYFHLKK
mgnify:CR=1